MFNPLELIAEELTSLMDSNSRGLKRAKTVRTEYLKDVDDVQRWLQEAEVKVQDRSSEPKEIKKHIQTIEDEISAINEKLNRAIKHGKEIVEKTKDEEEKEMIPKTIESLVGKMSQVKLWLDEKRNQIGDTLDAWQKFLSIYDVVMAWCQNKTKYLDEPITLSSLEVVKQKAHEFSAAVKSSKQQSKNLAEMSKELEIIALSTDVGHLPEKLEEANNAKNDIEGKLSEKNALLHETCEEWEQFERKLKDVKSFIEKSQLAIESGANKKRTLREQHDLREKMLADITIQRKKITLSTEKLQIHFRAGFGGNENIDKLAKDSLHHLDNLYKTVEEQAHNLEESLSQLDKYQQEIQHLRQKVITAEQQLRLTQSPTYLPHDRQKAVHEQDAFQEQIRVLQSKINSRTERIKLIIQRGSPISDPLLN